MRRVLILGGGFGGISAARTLRQTLPAADEVLLVDRRSHFMMGLRKPWALVGRATLDEGRRPLAALAEQGLQVVAGTVTALDPANRAAEVDGRRIDADALVVALGAQLAPDQVPGLAEHALNVYDPEQIPRAAEALERFRGGRVLVGVFGVPYKCPPAPYEMAFLVSDHFRERGISATVEVFTPQPAAIPLLGPASRSAIEDRLAERGVTFLPNRKALSVAPGEVVFADERRPFDLLLGVPPHRCPEVVTRSGLTDGGAWARVDPRTLETRFPGVYAIGDVTEIVMANGSPMPKAGVFAEAEGRVVAERIAAAFAGRPAEATFDGVGYCFMDLGPEEGLVLRGDFLAQPPRLVATEPSRQQAEEKRAFEAERLQQWFGR